MLADVFEQVRKMCLQNYKLDHYQYFRSPGLSLDAILKMRNAKLDLFSDTDMYKFTENGIGGEVSHIARRHSKVNKKYIKSYD